MNDIPRLPFDSKLFEGIDPHRLSFEFRSGLDCEEGEKPNFYFIIWKLPVGNANNSQECYVEMPEAAMHSVYKYVQSRCDSDGWDAY